MTDIGLLRGRIVLILSKTVNSERNRPPIILIWPPSLSSPWSKDRNLPPIRWSKDRNVQPMHCNWTGTLNLQHGHWTGTLALDPGHGTGTISLVPIKGRNPVLATNWDIGSLGGSRAKTFTNNLFQIVNSKMVNATCDFCENSPMWVTSKSQRPSKLVSALERVLASTLFVENTLPPTKYLSLAAFRKMPSLSFSTESQQQNMTTIILMETWVKMKKKVKIPTLTFV